MLGYAEPGREGATASSLSLTDTLGAALATGLSGAFIALGAAHGGAAYPRAARYTLPTLTGVVGIFAASRPPAAMPAKSGAVAASG